MGPWIDILQCLFIIVLYLHNIHRRNYITICHILVNTKTEYSWIIYWATSEYNQNRLYSEVFDIYMSYICHIYKQNTYMSSKTHTYMYTHIYVHIYICVCVLLDYIYIYAPCTPHFYSHSSFFISTLIWIIYPSPPGTHTHIFICNQ